MAPTVGLIGLGLMGKPMGRNLLKAGFRSSSGIALLPKRTISFAKAPSSRRIRARSAPRPMC